VNDISKLPSGIRKIIYSAVFPLKTAVAPVKIEVKNAVTFFSNSSGIKTFFRAYHLIFPVVYAFRSTFFRASP
jgi:hypothetical protein